PATTESSALPYTTLFRSRSDRAEQSSCASYVHTHLYAPRGLGKRHQREPARGRRGAAPSGRKRSGARVGRVSARDRVSHVRVLRSEEHTSELQSRENLVC